MTRHRSMFTASLAACLLASCATPGASPPPAHAVAAVGKVVASLGDETMQRLGTDRFRGSIPVLGSLTRSLTDREREAERAAARTTGLLVTFAAREGNTYLTRSHVVAVVSTGSADVALERK